MPQHQIITEQQEIQEIIGAMPQKSWFRGIFFILIIAISTIAITYFVPYPEVIEVPVIITTQQPLVEIKTAWGGEISTITVENKAEVKAGELLIVFKNSADYTQIISLKSALKTLHSIQNASEMTTFQLPKVDKLGVFTKAYGALEVQLESFKFQRKNKHIPQQIAALQGELVLMEQLNISVQTQVKQLSQKTNIAKDNFENFKQLLQNGAASKLEVDAAQTNWLRQQTELENKETQVIQNQLNIKKIHSQILRLQQSDDNYEKGGFSEVKQQTTHLLSTIETWEQQYLFYAPIDGKLVFTQRPSIGHFIPAGTTFFSIIPPLDEQLLAVGKLAGTGIGRAKKGIKTFIRLKAYPYKEFGELEGQIQNISNTPSHENGQNYYQIEIELPQQLTTTFDEKIDFRQEMKGLARIVTKDQSVLGRFLNNFVVK